MNIEEMISEVKGKTHTVCFHLISNFNSVRELEGFVERCRTENIGVSIKYKTDFYCGLFIECYDKNTCIVKQEVDS